MAFWTALVAGLALLRMTQVESAVAELLSPSGTPPAARAFHTGVVSKLGIMYVFGGTNMSDLNDTYAYDIGANSWGTVRSSGSAPAARCMHSAVFDDVSGAMFVYGGSSGSRGTTAYSVAKHSWTEFPPNGEVGRREGHSAVFVNATKRMWVFGGRRLETHGPRGTWMVWLNNLYSYDPTANEWAALRNSGKVPARRAFHTAVLDPSSSSIYVFGGFDAERDEDPVFGDFYRYDLATNQWSELPSSSPRYHHAAAFDTSAQKMYVAGGLDANRSVLSDVQVYDVQSQQWTVLMADGPQRWGHSMVLKDQHLFVFGGANIFSWVWSSAPKTDTLWRITPQLSKPLKHMRGSYAKASTTSSTQDRCRGTESSPP